MSIEGCHLFESWRRRFEASGCILKSAVSVGSISIRGIVYKRLVSVVFESPEGYTFERNILLGLDAVVVVPMFFKGEVPYFVVVEQRRVVDGRFSTEFPSGGVQPGCSSAETGLRELSEETGIVVIKHRLKSLSRPLKVCESSLSETVHWFYVKLRETEVPNDGEVCGIISENEQTVVKQLSYKELQQVNSFHVLSACELLRRSGLIKDLGDRS